jgi:cell division protein FtsW
VARKLKSDKVLFIATLLLVCTSIVMVYSASAAIASDKLDESSYFMTRQALWAVLGVAALAIAIRIDYRAYRNELLVYGVLGVIGLALVYVLLFGTPRGGATRWLNVGVLGIQPSEFAKIACAIFTAMILDRRMHRINEVRYSILPIAVVVLPIALLIYKEPDFGTAAALMLIVGVMLFAAGLHYRYLIGAALAGLPILFFLAISEAYRFDRILAFFNPDADPTGKFGYQAKQSMIAVGSGGVFGLGLTNGIQKMFYLPESHTDFIYAVISEELGIIGASAVLICFCVIAWRGLRIAMRAEDQFGTFVALGLTTMICAQAFINISVVLNLLPTKGIPLPLVSAGGSSMIVSLLAIGVLLNISQHATDHVEA